MSCDVALVLHVLTSLDEPYADSVSAMTIPFDCVDGTMLLQPPVAAPARFNTVVASASAMMVVTAGLGGAELEAKH